ncbi:MAG: hypothetical protein ACKVWR_16160 [Acidimicrobiales bacterium]
MTASESTDQDRTTDHTAEQSGEDKTAEGRDVSADELRPSGPTETPVDPDAPGRSVLDEDSWEAVEPNEPA